jgi:hypothetical protein
MAKKTQLSKPRSEAKFKYRLPDGYRPVYANGVWGGINVKGEIEMHFFYDSRPLPLTSTHKIEGGALIGTPISRTGDEDPLRFVQTGVIMSAVTAESFYEWLGEKLVDIRKMQKEMEDEKSKSKTE